MAQREKMHLSHLLHITGLRSSLKTISRASVLFSVVIFVFLDPTSAPQENRLQVILDAKVAYDKSLAAVQELFESGVITRVRKWNYIFCVEIIFFVALRISVLVQN